MKHLLTIGTLLIFAACGPNTSQTTATKEEQQAMGDTVNKVVTMQKDIVIKPLSGYFVKNTVKQTDSIQTWVINNAAEMQATFGMGKTISNTIDTVDFANNLLVAVTLRISDLKQNIELISSKEDGETVELKFSIIEETPQRPFTAAAAWLGAIPKTPGLKTVRFYKGEDLIRSVDVQ